MNFLPIPLRVIKIAILANEFLAHDGEHRYVSEVTEPFTRLGYVGVDMRHIPYQGETPPLPLVLDKFHIYVRGVLTFLF